MELVRQLPDRALPSAPVPGYLQSADMDDEAALQYLLGLHSVEERRTATAVPRAKLLSAVRALSSCQRCGFVEQVLAAFDPELGASSTLLSPACTSPSDNNQHVLGRAGTAQPGLQYLQSANAQSLPAGGPRETTGNSIASMRPVSASVTLTGGLLSPAQLQALVTGSNSTAPSELVSLLQFAWKDRDAASSGPDGRGGADAEGGGAGSGSGVVALSETLLGRPRLLQRFLTESKTTMKALAEEVGDCGRHVGYPGPTELASTLARLETQRCHTLERLAAWGVLRAQPQPSARTQSPGDAQARDQHQPGKAGRGLEPEASRQPGQGQQRQQAAEPSEGVQTALQPEQERHEEQLQSQRRQRASRDGTRASSGTGPGATCEAVEDIDEEEVQLQLALCLSLQDAVNSAAAEGPQSASGNCAGGNPLGGEAATAEAVGAHGAAAELPAGGSGGGPALGQQLQWGGAPVGVPSRRPQRTPPRPTGCASAGDGRALEQTSPARGLATWPGMSPSRSPGSAAGSATRRPTPPGPDGPGASLQGLAALGLVDDPQSSSAQQPKPAAAAPQPQPPHRLSVNPPASPPPSPAAGTQPTHEHGHAPADHTTADPQPVSGHAGPSAQPTAASPPGLPISTGGRSGLPAGPRLSVAAVAVAAAGLEDALVLVDSKAVAALPQGLRERVEHLVSQLVQVQQRRGRMEHACQHGVVAGARKLLLIMLQLMWDTLRRAAASATVAPDAASTFTVTNPTAAGTAPGCDAAAAAAVAPAAPDAHPTANAEGNAVTHAPSQQRRRPRYEGLLADLAAGLGDDDMYLDILGPELDLAAMGLASGRDSGSDITNTQPGSGRHRAHGAGGEAARECHLHVEVEEEIQLNGRNSSSDEGDGDSDGWLREVVTPGRAALNGAAGTSAAASPLPPLRAESPTSHDTRRRENIPLSPSSGNQRRQQPGVPLPVQSRSQPLFGASPGGGSRGGREARGVSEEGGAGGWDDARSSSNAMRLPTAALRSSQQAAWNAMRQRVGGSTIGATSTAGPSSAAPLGGSQTTASQLSDHHRQAGSTAAHCPLASGEAVRQEWRSEGLKTWPGLSGAGGGGGCRALVSGAERERSRWAGLERDAGGTAGQCSADCLAVRAEQAEQLRILQGQLERCQSSQAQLQGEVGRLLDMMAESRRVQAQASSSLRRDLALWQGDSAALQGLGADELAQLAGRMEAALSRVRAAHLQAAAERDLMCAVCWERRKGLVFGCGHQTCGACGEKLNTCPICRELITIRIRVYS